MDELVHEVQFKSELLHTSIVIQSNNNIDKNKITLTLLCLIQIILQITLCAYKWARAGLTVRNCFTILKINIINN